MTASNRADAPVIRYTVDPWYPGLDIKPAEAERSVRIMQAARATILPALGLPAE